MLRPYQSECVDTLIQKHSEGVCGQVVSLSTGTGKTRIASALPYRFSQVHHMRHMARTLFIVPGDELVWQAKEKFREANPDFSVGVEKADLRAGDNHDIVIASVQSLSRAAHLNRFDRDSFQCIGLDEVHHGTSAMYLRILKHFRALKSEPDFNPDTLLYGMTATTRRSDGVGLEKIMSGITFHRGILDMMRDGMEIDGKLHPWIVDVLCHRVDSCADLSKVDVKGKDLDEEQLAREIDTDERNRLVADSYLKLGEGMPAFAWTCGIPHSFHVVEALGRAGVPAAVMQGSTSREERQRLFAALDEGSLKVIASAGVLAEGVDRPKVAVGMHLRPHKANLPWTQKCGRVFRPYPAPEEILEMSKVGHRPAWIKPHAIIIDFVDNCGRHSLVGTPSLFGLRNDFKMDGKTALEVANEIDEMEERTGLTNLKEKKSLAEMYTVVERVDLLKPPSTPAVFREWSNYEWLEIGQENYQLTLSVQKSIRIKLDKKTGMYDVSRFSNGYRGLGAMAATLQIAIIQGDAMVPASEARVLREAATYHRDPPEQRQCEFLWSLDKEIKTGYKNGEFFYHFCVARFIEGNLSYSRGGVNALITAKQVARRPPWLQRKIAGGYAKRRKK